MKSWTISYGLTASCHFRSAWQTEHDVFVSASRRGSSNDMTSAPSRWKRQRGWALGRTLVTATFVCVRWCACVTGRWESVTHWWWADNLFGFFLTSSSDRCEQKAWMCLCHILSVIAVWNTFHPFTHWKTLFVGINCLEKYSNCWLGVSIFRQNVYIMLWRSSAHWLEFWAGNVITSCSTAFQ